MKLLRITMLLLVLLLAGQAGAVEYVKHSDVVRNTSGRVVGGASVHVYTADTTTLATIYSDASGTVGANPSRTDTHGRFGFYLTTGVYDITISRAGITTYTTEDVRVFGSIASGFDITDYGAIANDGLDDTIAIQAAVGASEAAAGGRVIITGGSFHGFGIDIVGAGVTIWIDAGSSVTCDTTDQAAFDVKGATDFSVTGDGEIIGPGKGSAVSGSNGISLTDVSNAMIKGVEISGFYHGIRPDDSGTSEDNTFHNLYIHDCAHTGLWPKEGDIVEACRFKDMGTTSQHHGIYINTAMDRGVRLIGNHYEGITGAGVHVHVETEIDINGIVSSGETFDGNGWGYVLSAGHASADFTNINISGAVINDCVVTTGDTGHGIHMITTGTISNSHIQAVINDSAAHGFNCDASAVSDSHFDLVINGSADYGAVLTSDNCTGRFVVHDGTSIGAYINGGIDNHYDITATANGNTGCYLTGASNDNHIKLYSSDNTGNGLFLGASTNDNRVSGICQGNSSAQASDSGTDNNLDNLTGAASAGEVLIHAMTMPSGGGGATTLAADSYYVGGFYEFAASANDFSTPPTLGTANGAYDAHVMVVLGSVAVDELTLNVLGTRIEDDGTRTASYNASIVIPNTTAVDSYFETSEKFIGAVVVSVTSGTAKICDYGWSAYWDNRNRDFTVHGGDAQWRGNATGALDVILYHHKATGWTYNGTGSPTPPTPIFQLSTIYLTESNSIVDEPGRLKIVNGPTAIGGSGSEGIVGVVITSVSNQLNYGQILVDYTVD